MNRLERRQWRDDVFTHPDLTIAQKLVLLRLETFADYPAGTNARPGVAALAADCGLGARVVEGALSAGRRLELIEQTARANPKKALAAVYRLLSTRTTVRVERDSSRTTVRVERDFNPHETAFQPARDDISTRTPVQPTNPLTPRENTKGGGAEPRCDRHRHHPDPPPSHACKSVREQTATARDDEKRAIIAAIDACRHCDPFGRLDDLTDCPRHTNLRALRAVV